MLSDFACREPARALLNEASEYVQASFLRESGKFANGLYRFQSQAITAGAAKFFLRPLSTK